MDRRSFVAAGVGGMLGAKALDATSPIPLPITQDDIRASFPRLARDIYVNAAAGTPLGTFAEAGLRRYMDFQQYGPGEGREEYVSRTRSEIRGAFAELIGARESEIGLVHCTKAGEQIVIDGLEALRRGGNLVTNDFHFGGSLHNFEGLRRAGMDVRVVRNREWDVSLGRMADAIDDRTALVAVTLVSNINGRREPLRELAEVAHARNALVYADIIQAAGIVPMDVSDLGIDFAACSTYKWLYGVHGIGFLYVKQDLQGTALPDRLFPGHANPNYAPWVDAPDPDLGAYPYRPRTDATRYQPGHVSYLGYAGQFEGLQFIKRIGVPQALRHSVRLNRRLFDQLDAGRYECLTPDVGSSPIITFAARDPETLSTRLAEANVVVSLARPNRVRVSPAVYNTEADIDRLAEAMA